MSPVQLKFLVRGLIYGVFAGVAVYMYSHPWFLIGLSVYYAFMLAGDVVVEINRGLSK